MHKKIASTFIVKLIIALLNLAIVIILSRTIGAQGKGEASIIVTSIAMILLFCNLVGGSSLVYFVPRFNVFLLFIFSNFWSVIVCTIAFFLIQFFVFIPESLVVPIIALSFISSLLATNLSIILGREKIKLFNFISLLQTLINFFVLLVLMYALKQANVFSYIRSLYWAFSLCLVISTIFVFYDVKKVTFNGSKKLLHELIKLGVLNQSGHIMKFASFRFSYYIMVAYSGQVVLGVFSNGVALIESLLIISNSFATILYPKISNSNDKKYSQLLTLQMTKASIVICIIAMIPLMALPSTFWIWLFGNEFAGVQYVILLLSPGIVFYNIVLIIGHYFSGTGNYKINLIANFVGLFLTIVLSIFVIPNYNATQAGIISSASYIGIAIITIFYFIRESDLKFYQILPTLKDFLWLKQQGKSLLK